jgi:hypothetical protein
MFGSLLAPQPQPVDAGVLCLCNPLEVRTASNLPSCLPLGLLCPQVAALGLEPHKHLGKSIRQLQPHLHRLRDRFDCNVCGEGGEYETLTLDCPAFTQGRIVLDSWEVSRQCCALVVLPRGLLQDP